MKKAYSNRKMETESAGREMVYFFPKPTPRSVRAVSREEAEKKLKSFSKKENE